MEANPKTVGELLRELFPGCDIAPGLERVQAVVETLANQMSAGLERVGEMIDLLDNAPAVPGYETMLVERGHHP